MESQSDPITHILTSRSHILPSLSKTLTQAQLNINNIKLCYPESLLFIITNKKISVCLPSSYIAITIYDVLYDIPWKASPDFVQVRTSCANSTYDILIKTAVDTQNTELLLEILRHYNMSQSEFKELQSGFC